MTRQHDVKRGHGFIQERPQADGSMKYQARWPEQDGGRIRYRSRTVGTLDEAEDLLRRQARLRRDGRYTAPSELTVAEATAQWVERGRHRWSGSTTLLYGAFFEQHVVPAFGKSLVRDLTATRIQHWLDGLVRERDGDTPRYRPATINVWATILSGFLDDMVRAGVLAANPAKALDRPRMRRSAKPTWSLDEIQLVIGGLEGEAMWTAIYVVMLSTGMRPGEARALRWSDVDVPGRRITINRTVTHGPHGKEIVGTTTKTGRSRSVALTPEADAALRTWRQAQRLASMAKGWRDDFVFTGRRGQFISDTVWRQRHKRLITETGVTPITLHQLRHTHATLAMLAGTHPRVVSEQLGHASITITLDMYSHVSPDLTARAADALSSSMFGTTTSDRKDAS